jgi:hypothetical protein
MGGLGDPTCDATGICLDTSGITMAPVTTPVSGSTYTSALQNLPLNTGVNTNYLDQPVLSASQYAALPANPPSIVTIPGTQTPISSTVLLLGGVAVALFVAVIANK